MRLETRDNMAIENVNTAQAFAGLARGAANAYKQTQSPEGKAQRAEARVLKEQREQQLAQMKDTEPTEGDYKTQAEINSAQLQNALMQAQEANAGLVQQKVYRAFDRFTGDYDPRHLNAMLGDVKKNPQGQRLFGDIVRVDKLTGDDVGLMKQKGLDPELVTNNPELMNGMVKTTTANGKTRIDDLTELFKMTGYEQYASDRELKRQAERARILQMSQKYGARTAKERQAARLAELAGLKVGTEEYQRFVADYIEQGEEPDPEAEFKTKDERAALRALEARDMNPGDEGFVQAYNQEYQRIQQEQQQSSKSRNLDEVDVAVNELNETVQSSFNDDFFDINFNDNRDARLKALPYIRRIEQLGGAELSENDKKTLHYVRGLTTMADPTSELTSEQTGLVDRLVRGVKKYVSDEVGGTAATSAYAAFRNTIRHALFGSVLTDGEIKAFNDQFGNLGQQTGPVLQQFQTALKQLEGKLSALYDTNDPYVIHYRAGVDQGRLVEIMDAIQERIDFFGDISNNAEVVETPNEQMPQGNQSETQLTPEQIEQLDALWNQSGGNQ